MIHTLLGAIAMGSMVASLFFLRFWRSTRDRFFLFFAIAFGLEGVNRIVQAWRTNLQEDVPIIYVIRLIAFGLILIAIFDKNRPRTRGNR